MRVGKRSKLIALLHGFVDFPFVLTCVRSSFLYDRKKVTWKACVLNGLLTISILKHE